MLSFTYSSERLQPLHQIAAAELEFIADSEGATQKLRQHDQHPTAATKRLRKTNCNASFSKDFTAAGSQRGAAN